MKKLTKFDKSSLRSLRQDIDGALIEIGELYGVSLTAGNASFTTSNATFKLNINLLNKEGVAETREMLDLKAFHPEFVNKKITLFDGREAKVVGFNRRAKKFPFLVETVDTKVYKVTSNQIKCGS